MRCTFDSIMRCAIVGSGLAALATYATLRHGGRAAEEIAVFGTHEDPTEVWRDARGRDPPAAHALGVATATSAPPSFPGLAVREAARRGSPAPLLRSAANRYHPSVDDFLAHAESVRERTRLGAELPRCSASSAIRAGRRRVRARRRRPVRARAARAPAIPGLARPDAFPGAVHAYEPHDYASKVAVVGAGMAAATEWLNALAAGAEVVSIRRREPLRRPLNVPRPFFSKRGLAALPRVDDRAARGDAARALDALLSRRRRWDEPVARRRARRTLPRRRLAQRCASR